MIKQTILILALLSLPACATKPINLTPSELVSVSVESNSPLYGNVSLEGVQGGKKKALLLGTNYETSVTNDNFNAALRETLTANGMWVSEAAKYLISTEIINVKPIPFRGFSTTIRSDIRYKVKDSQNDELILDEIISKTHSTKFSASLNPDKKLQLATEGSIQANINEFITILTANFSSENNNEDLIISFYNSESERDYLP